MTDQPKPSEKLPPELIEALYHPCKRTCAGWQDGYENGELDMCGKLTKEHTHLLAEKEKRIEVVHRHLLDIENTLKRYDESNIEKVATVKLWPPLKRAIEALAASAKGGGE